jgi:DNA-binding beta-propeller fold protein YncE
VLVVNTQDASVSRVDLTMQQTDRYQVGNCPYGIGISRDGKTIAAGVEDEKSVKSLSLRLSLGQTTASEVP